MDSVSIRRQSPEFNDGFHEGYIAGQQVGLMVLAEYEAKSIRPIYAKFTSEQAAEAFLSDRQELAAYRALGTVAEITARLAELERYKADEAEGPEIICLCGSTRFFKVFDESNFRLTLEGKIVLSIGCNTKSDVGLNLTADDKSRLDELHKRKIDLCDRVFVLNVGGYIGDSTRSEIAYAKAHGKPVQYLEPNVEPEVVSACGR